MPPPGAQYWVVNNSPPGAGPGGAAYTSYAIVRGTYDQAASIPNSGGVSGPYSTLAEAYAVWKAEPANQDVSTLTKIGQYFGTAVGYAVYSTSNPAAVVGAGKTGGQAADTAGSWLHAIAHWIGEAVAHILDIHMWRSIGWITLGIVLMTAGIFLWLQKADLIEPLPVPV
jgi:hypothetical protein